MIEKNSLKIDDMYLKYICKELHCPRPGDIIYLESDKAENKPIIYVCDQMILMMHMMPSKMMRMPGTIINILVLKYLRNCTMLDGNGPGCSEGFSWMKKRK